MPEFQPQTALGQAPIAQGSHVVSPPARTNATISDARKKRSWHYISLRHRLRQYKQYVDAIDIILPECIALHEQAYGPVGESSTVMSKWTVVVRNGPPLVSQSEMYKEHLVNKFHSTPQSKNKRNRKRSVKKQRDHVRLAALYKELCSQTKQLPVPKHIDNECDRYSWCRTKQRCTARHRINPQFYQTVSMASKGVYVVKRKFATRVKTHRLQGVAMKMFVCSSAVKEEPSTNIHRPFCLDDDDDLHFYANGVHFNDWDDYKSAPSVGTNKILGFSHCASVDYAVDPGYRD